jgi:GeoRSP system PqqD family protein
MRYRRKKGIAWREEAEARQGVLEALERGGDGGDEGTLILVDGGQIFELNLLGADIWKLCDGERTVEGIIASLLNEYDVSREELESDVVSFLEEMRERGWLERE